MRTALRTRATLLATAITGVTLVVASVALVLTLESRLTAGADALTRSRVNDLLELAASGDLPERLTNSDDEGVAQVVAADGTVLAASPNIAGRPRISDVEASDQQVVRTVDGPDDDETERYRLWVGSGDSPDGPVTVYVGTSLESVHEASRTLRQALLVGGPLVLLLLAAGTWLVLGGALHRVDRIRLEVDEITEDRLDRRVPETEVDDEVGRLASTMNRMLARLEAARSRQRSFVADVSHDLQSPLAAQRAQLEVAQAYPGATDVSLLTTRLLSNTTELEHLVRDLLFLAASDAGASPAPACDLDLEDVVLEEAARARAGTAVELDTSHVSAAPVFANKSELQRIVRNLLDNAVAHAREAVRLVVTTEGATARLDVIDDGPGVQEDERDLIFERFHRGDTSRSRHASGSGLGLAIARTLAETHGGTLQLVPETAGGHFVLRLPATPSSGGHH